MRGAGASGERRGGVSVLCRDSGGKGSDDGDDGELHFDVGGGGTEKLILRNGSEGGLTGQSEGVRLGS